MRARTSMRQIHRIVIADCSDMIAGMFRAIVFFGLTTSAFATATLDVLVNAAASFSATIQQQLEMPQSNPSPAGLAEKTIDYAEAKEAYFKALRQKSRNS